MATSVSDNKYRASKATLMNAHNEPIAMSENRKGLPKQNLPDGGFEYKKNLGCEKMTKPDPPLVLPKGYRYNIATGGLQQYPSYAPK